MTAFSHRHCERSISGAIQSERRPRHSEGFIPKNLLSQNILFTKNLRLLHGDFGKNQYDYDISPKQDKRLNNFLYYKFY